MGFVPQTNNVFTSMTVLENLEMGGFTNQDKLENNIAEVFKLFPVLEEKKSISRGVIGRAKTTGSCRKSSMTNPKLLMLDEPNSGSISNCS